MIGIRSVGYSRLWSFGGGGGFKIMNFNIFWGYQKNNIFWGYEDFVDFLWGHYKIELYLGSFLCILGSFLKVKLERKYTV